MKFAELLLAAIRRSEIPLRFEPGAEEAVAAPVTELLRAWLETHQPSDSSQQALLAQLIDEVTGARDLPA